MIIPDLTLDERLRFNATLRREGDCRVWTGPIASGGRGAFWIVRGGRRICLPAHLVALKLAGIVPRGRRVLPSCRNGLCCAVEHYHRFRRPLRGVA